MRVRIIIEASMDDSVFDDIEDGYGAAAAAVADSIRRDTGVNEYVDTDAARIDVGIGQPAAQPIATAITYGRPTT